MQHLYLRSARVGTAPGGPLGRSAAAHGSTSLDGASLRFGPGSSGTVGRETLAHTRSRSVASVIVRAELVSPINLNLHPDHPELLLPIILSLSKDRLRANGTLHAINGTSALDP